MHRETDQRAAERSTGDVSDYGVDDARSGEASGRRAARLAPFLTNCSISCSIVVN